VVVIADRTAPPPYIASDLLAQAEHNPGSAVLVVWEPEILDGVQQALEQQLATLSRADVTRDCLEQFSAFVLARNEKEAIAITNQLAPEHLHIATATAEAHAEAIDNAGAIFLGNYTPVALGDYAAGPSHVLPTGGAARFSSGLSANDFLKRSSILSFTREGLESIAPDVELLAQREGLTAHALSVSIRRESK
jgi:histidinol dehydrogenase